MEKIDEFKKKNGNNGNWNYGKNKIKFCKIYCNTDEGINL